MAGMSGPPPVPEKDYKVENEINRPPSSSSTVLNGNGSSSTPTITQASLAPAKPPTRVTSPNPRALVKWGKRTVVVCVPADVRDESGEDIVYRRPPVMSKEEVMEKMKRWESLGYGLEIFDSNGQSRAIYPEEIHGRVGKSEIIVNIPDREEWEAYMQQVREEKLRKLGVLLGDDPIPLPNLQDSRGGTPMGLSNSQMSWNGFQPPSQPPSAMGHQFHMPFAPSITPHLPSPTIPPPGHGQFPFHLPRQSISIQGGIRSPGLSDWEGNIYPGTSPNPLSGVWSPPFARGGSPAMSGMGGHSRYNSVYTMENNIHPRVGDFQMPGEMMHNNVQRFHQQQQNIRRGSPLAHVREMSIQQPIQQPMHYFDEPQLPPMQQQMNQFVEPQLPPIMQPSQPFEEAVHRPMIVEPVPKHHRNQPSINLQREMQGVEKEAVAVPEDIHQEVDEEQGAAFWTNPTSPAPPTYSKSGKPDILYPQQPPMPELEVDVHLGQELASNPDDDVTDEEAVQDKKSQEVVGKPQTQDEDPQTPSSGVGSEPRYTAEVTKSTVLSMPEEPNNANDYYLPHSRSTSLNQNQQQFRPWDYASPPVMDSQPSPWDDGGPLSLNARLQHQYDSVDPIEHSAMAMLVAGDGIGQGLGQLNMNVLSEDERTNISEIMTNPSQPPSPRHKYSETASHHSHHMSASSIPKWTSNENSEPSKPKFNANASEFKFDPAAAFGSPPIGFQPPTASSTFGGFRKQGFNVAAPDFKPTMLNMNAQTAQGPPPITENFSYFSKVSSFNPAVPTFTPSSFQLAQSTSSTGLPPILQDLDIVPPAPTKKIIPIVRPASRETEPDEKDRTQVGVRKRIKQNSVDEEALFAETPAVTETIAERTEQEPEPALHATEEKKEKVEEAQRVEEKEEEVKEEALPEESENEDVVDEVSSDEAEALMEKDPIEVVTGKKLHEFNPYELKTITGNEDLSIARPSSAFGSRRGSKVRTPDTTEEDDSLPELSEDPNASFAAQIASLHCPSDAPSPPPKEDQPPPPPGRRSSLFPDPKFVLQATAEDFNFDFNAQTESFTPMLNPSTPQPLSKTGGMAASKYAIAIDSTPSPRGPLSLPQMPAPILSPTISNPYSPVPEPVKDEEEFLPEEEEDYQPGNTRPTDSELDAVFQELSFANGTTYIEQHDEEASDEELQEEEEEHELAEEEDAELEEVEQITPWKQRTGPRRPGIPNFDEPLTPYQLLPPRSCERSAAPSPSPGRVEQYRHHASNFSSDAEATRLMGTFRIPDLEPAERYRSTAIGIAAGDVDSDWNDMISESGNHKLRPQSRLFFDNHVEALVGGLLQTHLGPVERLMEMVHDLLTEVSMGLVALETSRSTARVVHSDADDEDDEAGSDAQIARSPRPPRKDRKMEKIKAALIEALVLHTPQQQATVPVAPAEGTLEKMKEAILEALAMHNPQQPAIMAVPPIVDNSDIKAALVDATNELEARLEGNKTAVEEALRSVNEKLEQGDSQGMVVAAISRLEHTVKERERTVFQATEKLEERLHNNLSSKHNTMIDATTSLADQLDEIDKNIQISKKGIEDKVLWVNKSLIESNKNLEERLVVRQASAMELTKGLEEKLLDYGMIVTEHAKGLEEKLLKKDDSILNATKSLGERVDQGQQVAIAETRAIAVKFAEAAKSLELKVKDNNRTVYEATKNLENRLHERDMAMVLDARQFIEEKLKESDQAVIDVTRSLNEKLQKRDSAVIAEATKSLEEKLKERDRAILDATRRLEAKIKEKDMGLILDATKSLEEKSQAREQAFVEATRQFERKLQERDNLIVNELNRSLVEKMERSNDLAPILQQLENIHELHKRDSDVAEELGEKMLARDEALEKATESLEQTLRERDSVIVTETVHAVQSFEARLYDERAESNNTLLEIKAAVQELLDRDAARPESVPVAVVDSAHAEELERKLAERERELAEARTQVDELARLKKEVQERALDLQMKLTVAEEEKDRQKELADEKDRRLKALDDKRHQTLTQSQMRSALLEGAHSSLQKSVSDLSARNAVLEGSLQEAKAANERIMLDIQMAQNENRELRRTIDALRGEMEESIRVREGFRTKFNKLQEDMRTASAEIGQENAKWRRREEEQKARIEVLEARLAAEIRAKENSERDIERLRAEEREAIRLRVELEHERRHGSKMEELSDKLRAENIDHQQKAALLQVDVNTARQAARDEVARVTAAMQRDVETANNEVNLARATLEKQIEQARSEVDRVMQDAEVAKEKSALMLDEAAEAQKTALQEAAEAIKQARAAALQEATEAKTAALQEQHRKYERQLEELRAQHERAVLHTRQDGERDQQFLRQNLTISQNQAKHLREKIAHLEDRLQVATTAAQAAAKAAREAKSGGHDRVGSVGLQKVSSQALRETIAVLQEQLHERESRAEELEQKLETLEQETSKKSKDNELEITWLRELLTLRVAELEEITNTLQLPSFDREVVRNAAVRLKANLQMEQQVRDRSSGAGDFSPTSLATNLAKLPLAAAWGNWRKGGKVKQENEAQSPLMTPSRPSSSQSGFLGGLLTPPSLSNAQKFGSRLAGFAPDMGRSQPTLSSSNAQSTPMQKDKEPAGARSRNQSREENILSLRRGSYDDDADVSVLGGVAGLGGMGGMGMGDSGLGGSYYDDGGNADFSAFDDDETPPFKMAPYMRG